jgi:hypothetical protein
LTEKVTDSTGADILGYKERELEGVYREGGAQSSQSLEQGARGDFGKREASLFSPDRYNILSNTRELPKRRIVLWRGRDNIAHTSKRRKGDAG